ncbi:Dihydroflavonol-4-reductase [Arthrobotrys entomopaga]|nr:Dihydroflavonol-4-reductase [Arthrobotrys entomopaga]
MPPNYILVTGATGFIGAHVVSQLLSKNVRVRAAYRSQHKADTMLAHFRKIHGNDKIDRLLDFSHTGDLSTPGCFDESLTGGIEGVIHCASPLNFTLSPADIINPAIEGTKSLLASITSSTSVKKLVFLSSFAAVVDESGKGIGPEVEYTSRDWNPITYEEGINARDGGNGLRLAYQASKTLSEREVWKWSETEIGKRYDVVSLCAPLVFGPVAYPIEKISELNSSNAELWFLTTGFSPLPVSNVPQWISVHDLTTALANAVLLDLGSKRYTLASPAPFSTQLAADTIRALFPWGRERVTVGDAGKYPRQSRFEGEIAREELLGGEEYRGWRETMMETLTQFKQIEDNEKSGQA